MDSNKIKLLLTKYLEGSTSLSEEETLRLYFKTTENIPSEWEGYRMFFGYFDLAKTEGCPKGRGRQKFGFRPWMAVAAIIAVIALFVGYQNLYLLPLEDEATSEMFTAEIYFAKDSFNLALNGFSSFKLRIAAR